MIGVVASWSVAPQGGAKEAERFLFLGGIFLAVFILDVGQVALDDLTNDVLAQDQFFEVLGEQVYAGCIWSDIG